MVKGQKPEPTEFFFYGYGVEGFGLLTCWLKEHTQNTSVRSLKELVRDTTYR